MYEPSAYKRQKATFYPVSTVTRPIAGISRTKSRMLLIGSQGVQFKSPPIQSIQPEREPDSAAEDAEEPLEGRIPHGARQAEGQLVTRGKGAEEEPGTGDNYVGNFQ